MNEIESKLNAIVKAIDMLLERENVNSANGFEVILSIRGNCGNSKVIQSGLVSGTIGGIAESILKLLEENAEVKYALAKIGLQEYKEKEEKENKFKEEKFRAKWN